MSNFLTFVFAVGGMTSIMLLANFPLVKWLRESIMNYKPEEASIPKLLIPYEGLCIRYMRTRDYLFEKAQELFSCPMCMGWWCGLVMALLLYPAGWVTFPLACAGSFVGRQVSFIETWLEANSLVDVGNG